ncbi:MAG TPA: terminase family protein [Beijerinckiaceae bacterium]|nr:terminase family protein [Beijerinckiaceae bacterium]
MWRRVCPLHDHQLPPKRACDDWTTWLVLGGRGAGKTRAGAEWVMGLASGFGWLTQEPVGRIALVGETFAAARDVMIEGPAGLLKIHEPGERPAWSPTLRKLEWPNGAVAHVFSAEDPDSLRGPQFEAAWCDELAKWRHVEETWDMLQFGLRLGARPREIVTTTPRPIPLLRRLLSDERVAVSRAATEANAQNLSPAFLDRVVGRYAGTLKGRQELGGEMVEDRPDALWTRDAIERLRVERAPPLARIVVRPAGPSGREADACGIVAAGVDAAGVGYVIADATVQGLPPQGWAERAVSLYRRLQADALVVETNQGGEMVEAVVRQVDPGVPVTPVHAKRGKFLRAEPVSSLYAKDRVHHVGAFPALEDEMCDFGPAGLSSGRSPDRLDALVWALSALMLQERAEPRVRAL